MKSDLSLRMTHQRRVILEELRKVQTHPAADEIYKMVRGILPRISLGTVYRNLEILSDLGYVEKLEFGGQKRFDGNIVKHCHIQCMGCGSIDDMPEDIVENIQIQLNKTLEYRIYGYRLLFLGVCRKCDEKGFVPSREIEKRNESE